ncbi:MAG: dTDP-4-dehydrorhamnose reductase [Acidimicrobiales bacterium]
MGRSRRVLITGAAGQVGRELVEAFEGEAAWTVVACDRAVLDVADREQVLQLIGAAQPEVVVHAAAYTDVDGCQLDPGRAYQANALATRHVAEAARLVGARVAYLSTDYVFDGMASRPYNEWDAPNPLSVYGHSKLGGEAELSGDDTVVRTSWVCGHHGRNFLKTVLGRAGAGQPLRVVDDQFGCPTFADDLAQMVKRLVVARMPGTYHVTNQGPTSWYRFARDIVAAAGLDADLVSPICTGELDPPRPAPRPHSSVLDNAALRLSGVPLLPDFHEGLERLVKDLTSAT